MRVSGYDCCRYCMSGCEVGMLKKNFLRLSSCYYHHHSHSLPTSITSTFALLDMGMEMEVEGVMVYRIIWVGSGLRFSILYRYHSPTILTHDHSSHTHLATARLPRRLLRLIWGLEVEVERVMVCGIMLVGSRFRFSILLRYHYQ